MTNKNVRLRLGRWLLKPYLDIYYARADAALQAETAHGTYRGGYRQGVFSAVNNIRDLRVPVTPMREQS
jgi:hypothetical protein